MIDMEKIIREYIDKTVHMSLATVSDNKPWVCEVHFAYDDELNLYWRSTANRRHSVDISRNPYVAGNIVPTYSLEEGCGGAIYFEGKAKLLTDQVEIEAAFPAFQKCLGKTEEIIEDALTEGGHGIYKVEISNWAAFGKFGEDSLNKHELKWK